MIDNLREILRLWKAQYKSLQDLDEKMVMLSITVAILALILLFAVVITWLIITFIKMVWPFVLAFVVVFGVIKLWKWDSK